jgi:hypothetical protein
LDRRSQDRGVDTGGNLAWGGNERRSESPHLGWLIGSGARSFSRTATFHRGTPPPWRAADGGYLTPSPRRRPGPDSRGMGGPVRPTPTRTRRCKRESARGGRTDCSLGRLSRRRFRSAGAGLGRQPGPDSGGRKMQARAPGGHLGSSLARPSRRRFVAEPSGDRPSRARPRGEVAKIQARVRQRRTYRSMPPRIGSSIARVAMRSAM